MHKFTKRTPRLLSLIAASTLALTGSVVTLNPTTAAHAASTGTFGETTAVQTPAMSTAINPHRVSAPKSPEVTAPGRYIVVLTGKPTVTYEGTVAGLPATKPKLGEKLISTEANVQKYETHLKSAQAEIATEKGVQVKKNFTTALNGFVANLDVAQARELAKDPRVLMITADRPNELTEASVDSLGLTGKNGVWQQQFSGPKDAGAGTVVGIIDSGYYPQSPYLKGAAVKPLAAGANPVVGVPYLKSPGVIAMLKKDGTTFEGECQVGEEFAASTCNSKVISARYFDEAFVASVPKDERHPTERLSPLDIGSHGTHTASTAAGNRIAKTVVSGLDRGPSSGVAPAAKVAVYKVCWEDNDPTTAGGCYPSASVDAINQAVIDGVDVLNYSISSDPNTTTDPVSLAFLSAVSSGVFVSNSAGNSGSTPSTVVHGAPWLTSVAATTWTNQFSGTVVLSDGTKYRGGSLLTKDLPAAPLAIAADSGVADAVLPAQCRAKELDPVKVKGKIVVCDRGVNGRVEKAQEVKRAGGVGIILVNMGDDSIDADASPIPMVHIDNKSGVALKAKLAKDATLKASLVVGDTTGLPALPLPQVAGFSSRGPLQATRGDLLKPDIAAPGVNVISGFSPIGADGEVIGLMSGTSMAAPHIAGMGALLLSKNPKWTASQVKSAMMLTAEPTKNADGSNNTDYFGMGAGQISPSKMFTPPVAIDAQENDYLNYLAGQGLDLGIEGVKPVAARDMNVPSIALGGLTGTITVKRTITALEAGTYQVKAEAAGLKVAIAPSIVTFTQAGERRAVNVTITRTNAALGKYTFGKLTIEGNGRKVALPMAIQPISVDAPEALSFSSIGGSGTGVVPIRSGNTGSTKANIMGLVKAASETATAVPGPLNFTTGPSSYGRLVVIPEGTKLARFEVKSSDPLADWDLYLVSLLGIERAATPSASEVLEIRDPLPGKYILSAHLYASPGNASTTAEVTSAMVTGDAKNSTFTPNPITLGNGLNGTVNFDWSGLETGSYVGLASFTGSPYQTVINVEVKPDPKAKPKPTTTTAPAPSAADLKRMTGEKSLFDQPRSVNSGSGD